jgi:hypothetical protein
LRASRRTSRKSQQLKLAKRTQTPRWQEKVVRMHRETEATCQIFSMPAGNQFCQTNPGANLAHVSTENACKANPPVESSATPHEKITPNEPNFMDICSLILPAGRRGKDFDEGSSFTA